MLKTSLIHLSANHWVTSIQKEDIIKSNDLWKERNEPYIMDIVWMYTLYNPQPWLEEPNPIPFALL
jgi:hypothetical protein